MQEHFFIEDDINQFQNNYIPRLDFVKIIKVKIL